MDVLDRLFRRLVQNLRAGHPHYLGAPFEVGELSQTLVPYRHNRAELGIEMNQDYEAALMRLLAGERGYVEGDPVMQRALAAELSSPNPDTTLYREFASAHVRVNADAAARVEPSAAPRAGEPTPTRASLADAAGAMQQAAAEVSAAAQSEPAAGAPPAPPAPDAPAAPAARPSLAHTGVMSTLPAAETPARPSGGARAGAEAAFPDPSAFGFPLRTPTPASAPRASTPLSAPAAPAPAPRPPTSSTSAPQATAPAPAAGILAEGSCGFCGGTLPDGRRITYCPHCGQNLTVRQCPACSTELEIGWRFCVTCGRQNN